MVLAGLSLRGEWSVDQSISDHIKETHLGREKSPFQYCGSLVQCREVNQDQMVLNLDRVPAATVCIMSVGVN